MRHLRSRTGGLSDDDTKRTSEQHKHGSQSISDGLVNPTPPATTVRPIVRYGCLTVLALYSLYFLTGVTFPGLLTPFGFTVLDWLDPRRPPASDPNAAPSAITTLQGSVRRGTTPAPLPGRQVDWEHWSKLAQGDGWNQTSSQRFRHSMRDRHLLGGGGGSGDEVRGRRFVGSEGAAVGTGVGKRQLGAPATTVAVFKLPRSGSTWFTEKLNALPSVFISKEIIQAEPDEIYSQLEKLRHLKRALRWPTGKMSTGAWGGRFRVDYWDKSKWARRLDVLGFTVNPVKVQMDYHRLMRRRPEAVVVAFMRTNVVKTTVSAVRGALTHKLCGTDNLTREQAKKCRVPGRVRIDVEQFWAMLVDRLRLERRFVDLVYSVSAARSVYEVTYEDLQRDETAVLRGLLVHLGATNVLEGVRTSAAGGGWVKRTSDDLRDALENFDELRTMLLERGNPCLVAQLDVALKGAGFPPCPLTASQERARPAGALPLPAEGRPRSRV